MYIAYTRRLARTETIYTNNLLPANIKIVDTNISWMAY